MCAVAFGRRLRDFTLDYVSLFLSTCCHAHVNDNNLSLAQLCFLAGIGQCRQPRHRENRCTGHAENVREKAGGYARSAAAGGGDGGDNFAATYGCLGRRGATY